MAEPTLDLLMQMVQRVLDSQGETREDVREIKMNCDVPSIVTTLFRLSQIFRSPMNITVRDFKSQMSKYLRRAQAGEHLTITSHRKPVARVLGIPAAGEDGPSRLVASGAASWSGGKPSGANLSLADDGTPISQMVLEDRA